MFKKYKKRIIALVVGAVAILGAHLGGVEFDLMEVLKLLLEGDTSELGALVE